MLQHPDSLYLNHQLRHQELIAEAERFRLANQALGRRSSPMGTVLGLARRVAALAGTFIYRGAPGHEVRPQYKDDPAKSAS